jgi:hypothetical protein
LASDIEGDGNPRRNARKQYLSSGISRSEGLNEQPALTRWTTEPKSKDDSDALANDENRKGNGD